MAEGLTPAAESAAPGFKAWALIALPVATGGAATPFIPFLAPLPAQAFLPAQVSVPLFLFSQTFREGIASDLATETAPGETSALIAHFLTAK